MEKSFHTQVKEYQRQLQKGEIQTAYQGLIQYMMDLRTHFQNQFSPEFVVGSLYQGYMDMTYFPATPKELKQRKLKIGVVLDHKKLQFSVCLLGQNKQVMKEVWEELRAHKWEKYDVPPTPQETALEFVIVQAPNFDDLEALTKQLETAVLAFIKDVQIFLAR